MTAARKFDAKPAIREHVPLLIGLMGPSGGGKSYSALRLATGIQTVSGGEIYMIDTEARRGLHYADQFKFKHVEFNPPFASLDYLSAIEYCVKQGAGVVVVDSMSHEHEGPGGMLDYHDHELQRLAGDDYSKRERFKMLAWQKPKADRRTLINGLLQLNANFVFCFRAKETVKPMKVDGKTQIVPQGFMPIAGAEFVFEMTTCCLLLPGAHGVPTWVSENVGEKQMIKSATQFAPVFNERKPLDESTGRALAEWARGKSSPVSGPAKAAPPESVQTASPQGGAASVSHEHKLSESERLTVYDRALEDAAKKGMKELEAEWNEIPKGFKSALRGALDRRHKPMAIEADAK